MKINLNELAKEKLLNFIESKNKSKEDISFKVFVSGYNWGGPNINLVLEESNTDDANTMTVDDIRFIISDNLDEFVEELNIDYINKWYRKGFLITYNGKSASTC